MRVLLSVKPRFAHKIFSGEKKYEYRKSIFKNSDVKIIIVYASSPVQRVIGEFEIDTILYDELDALWEATEHSSGISKDCFYNYFSNRCKGYAIKIKNYKRYDLPLGLSEHFRIAPPQSFAYV